MTPFRAAHAQEEHWGLAAKACLDAVGGARPGDNVGFVYVTRGLADSLSSTVTLLRETTGIDCWIGAAGFGIYAPGAEIHDGPAMAMMIGALPGGAAQAFAFGDGFVAEHGVWLDTHAGTVALVHGDPRNGAEDRLAAFVAASGAYLVGGFTPAVTEREHVAGRSEPSRLSGLLVGPPAGVLVALAQGCSPIGPPHVVTECADTVVIALDDRPALDVLRDEAGELISRDLRRAAGYIHAALPVAGCDTGTYVVRGLSGVDTRRGWIEVAAEFAPGDRLLFVRRDAATARRELRRSLGDLRRRLDADGRRPLGAVYISCVGRGPLLFGEAGAELALVEAALGPVPLVGFAASGEICRDRLHMFSGILAVFVGDTQ